MYLQRTLEVDLFIPNYFLGNSLFPIEVVEWSHRCATRLERPQILCYKRRENNTRNTEETV